MSKLAVDVNIKDLEVFNRIAKDRLDFGFDSIYFRYAEVVDELSWLKLKEERGNNNMNFDQDKVYLFEEKKVYNALIDEKAYPFFANSFLVEVW
jgi:hypothetical protein